MAGTGRPKASSVPAPLSQKAAQAAAAASRMARARTGIRATREPSAPPVAAGQRRQVDRQQHGGDRDGAASPRHHPPQSEDFGR